MEGIQGHIQARNEYYILYVMVSTCIDTENKIKKVFFSVFILLY